MDEEINNVFLAEPPLTYRQMQERFAQYETHPKLRVKDHHDITLFFFPDWAEVEKAIDKAMPHESWQEPIRIKPEGLSEKLGKAVSKARKSVYITTATLDTRVFSEGQVVLDFQDLLRRGCSVSLVVGERVITENNGEHAFWDNFVVPNITNPNFQLFRYAGTGCNELQFHALIRDGELVAYEYPDFPDITENFGREIMPVKNRKKARELADIVRSHYAPRAFPVRTQEEAKSFTFRTIYQATVIDPVVQPSADEDGFEDGEDRVQQVPVEEVLDQFKSKLGSVLSPKRQAPHFHLGNAYQTMGLYEDAIREYLVVADSRRVSSIRRTDALNLAAMCYRKIGKLGEAEALVKRSIEVAPEGTRVFDLQREAGNNPSLILRRLDEVYETRRFS